jgi:hypothetical protein
MEKKKKTGRKSKEERTRSLLEGLSTRDLLASIKQDIRGQVRSASAAHKRKKT